eukprot:5270427-Pyramimonas_sp.AAC.1
MSLWPAELPPNFRGCEPGDALHSGTCTALGPTPARQKRTAASISLPSPPSFLHRLGGDATTFIKICLRGPPT